MTGQVREVVCQFIDDIEFSAFVICQCADILGDVLAELLRQCSARVATIAFGKKLSMLTRRIFLVLDMQLVLKRNLLERAGALELWNCHLHGFKIKEIQWIGQSFKKRFDIFMVDERLPGQR